MAESIGRWISTEVLSTVSPPLAPIKQACRSRVTTPKPPRAHGQRCALFSMRYLHNQNRRRSPDFARRLKLQTSPRRLDSERLRQASRELRRAGCPRELLSKPSTFSNRCENAVSG